MKTPWRVHRCTFKNGILKPAYLGLTDFEVGEQSESLSRILHDGIQQESVTLMLGDVSIPVYLIAGTSFHFEDYKPHLESIAGGNARLLAQSRFDEVVQAHLDRRSNGCPMNLWFDFENDVMWSLDEDVRDALVPLLPRIATEWTT